jgi:hypothetical protein
MTRALIVVGLVASLAVGCNKSEKKPEPMPTTETKPVASASAAAPKQAAEAATLQTGGEPETKVADGDIPTKEDYEEEASTKMAKANLELELDALEAEIGN